MSKKRVIVRAHNSSTGKLTCILSLVLILMAFITSVNAQVLYGSLTGTVTDPSGAAVGAAFGVTNTPHFNTPNANVSGAFNSNGTLNPNSNFGTITGTIGGRSGTNLNGARTFWFAAKLMF